MHTTSTLIPNRPQRVARLVGAGLLAAVVGASLTACASDGSASDDETTTTTLSGDETTTTVADGGSSDEGGTTGGGTTGGGTTGGGTTGGGTTGGGQPTGPAPKITSFTTPENIDCHNGNFQQFTARWSTTDAVQVTISIDGPGVYDTYPANGETSLPFNCSSSHTFLLTAIGQDGQTATKSVTLQPRNVPSAGGDDDE